VKDKGEAESHAELLLLMSRCSKPLDSTISSKLVQRVWQCGSAHELAEPRGHKERISLLKSLCGGVERSDKNTDPSLRSGFRQEAPASLTPP